MTQSGLEGLLHTPVFAGVKGQEDNAAAGIEAFGKHAQELIERDQFLVDGDAEGLKKAADRFDAIRFGDGLREGLAGGVAKR